MRRMWAASAAIVVCLALGGLPVAGQESSGQPSAASTTIGFSSFYTDIDFFGDIGRGAQEAALTAGVELIALNAYGDATMQADHLESFIADGVDAIIIVPVDPDAIVPAVEAANAVGIPVLAVDRTASGGIITSLIASDNVAAARMAGEALFRAMGGSGKVVEVQGDMAVSTGKDRSEGFQQALEAAPGITLAVQAPADFSYSLASQATRDALEEDPDITGVFAANQDMLEGAAQAVASDGMSDQVSVVGFDTSPTILTAINDGSIDATIAQQPQFMGQRAVEAALAATAGQPVDPFIPVETILVTSDNVGEFVTGEAVPAESPTAASPVFVTGTEVCGARSEGTASYLGGLESYRDETAECVNTMSDPRIDGTYINTLNADCYLGGACVLWGTHVLDGPDGGWDCSWSGTQYPVWEGFLILGVCPGTGGFEGLTYVFRHGSADFGDGSSFHGVIYEGPAPMVFATPPEAGK